MESQRFILPTFDVRLERVSLTKMCIRDRHITAQKEAARKEWTYPTEFEAFALNELCQFSGAYILLSYRKATNSPPHFLASAILISSSPQTPPAYQPQRCV